MATYRLTAPKKLGTVPAGFSFTVNSGSNCGPSNQEVRDALKPFGYDPEGYAYYTNFKWEII